ncbi:jacalin-related lectin 4-like [Rhodamnia argentea]|uniref:Jacalin-related lectin 4-like n=1 Tax=Rhodamnia argentea TaxID=178133 RepID=A0ABM3GXD9_9MYRT|nr:jacalin-related lectin 4-like [Rhodamnia argentea]
MAETWAEGARKGVAPRGGRGGYGGGGCKIGMRTAGPLGGGSVGFVWSGHSTGEAERAPVAEHCIDFKIMFPSPSPPPPPLPPPPPPGRPPQWIYDVFVSFRGKDLRRNFISHLFSALRQASIQYFSDNAREDIGEEIKSKLFRAIWHARISLIVFSRSYADSKWCMNELVEILECKKRFGNHGHLIVPIFHDVKPEDISRLTSGSEFAQGFERLRGNERDDRQIQKWRDALRETKHLSGFDLRNDAGEDERTLVDIIVKYLVEKIRETRLLNFATNAIGVELLVGEVISLIKMGQEEDVRVVGICGVEGIGKTTVAAVICERIRSDFQCFVFLDKIGEADCNSLVGLLGLQKKLLHNLIKVEGLRTYDDIQTNINEINSNISRKRILLVLDNVTRKEQIDYFGAGEREHLCPGSRILITTKDQNLLKDLKVDDKYIVRGLDPNEALRLFCRHAMKREEPEEAYEELSRSLAHYAGGHPSSLKRLGLFLNGKPKHQWHQTLEKLVRSPYLDSLSPSFWSVGPYGGQGSVAFDDGRRTGVRQIRVHGGSVIDSITIDYDQNGCLVRSLRHGGGHIQIIERVGFLQIMRVGFQKLVKLDHPSEYLVSISGHIDNYGGHDVIQSLKIHSNKKTYGPFGSERGRPFDLSHFGGRIIGFHGKCGSHIDSIGAHFRPISHVYPFDAVGPFGGDSGMDIWDDGKHTGVRQIVVGFDSAIKSISILYDEHGCPVGPFTHGPSGGGKTYTIKLDHPSEYLTSISGYTEEVSGLTILQSLTIHTNTRDHGPIGTANKGRHFSFPYTGGKIIGFHGTCDGPRLESIGAFYEPIPHSHPIKVFGPFGGEGEKSWDFADIKGIDVHCADYIKSITFQVDDATSTEPETNYGVNGGENTFKVKLRNGEYITSFAGYLKNANDRGTLINSLTFETNGRILGPIGREEGEYFSLPSKAGKVTGFFGRSCDYLESIGATVEPNYPFNYVGLFGSAKEASFWNDGNKHTNVRKIIVEFEPSKGSYMRSITFQYEEENKELWQSETHGGIDDRKFHIVKTVHTIQIHDPDEYLTSISGYCFLLGITSLTFQTNKKTIGPIGDEGGWHFSCPATGGKIVGFYGTSGEYLESIGVYFQPISHLYPIISTGPFGGLGGSAWDDGKFNGVMEIEVMYDDVVCCIKFAYDKSGERVCSVMHGGRSGRVNAMGTTRVIFDYPREYLTSISGYKRENGDDADNAIVQSLTFYSNRGRYGPFGIEMGKYFWYPSTGSKIIGFYGRSSKTLNSIGVYAEPVPHLYPREIFGPFGGSGGTPWDDGVHTDVRGFYIYVDLAVQVITGIRIAYDNNGASVQCSRHGIGEVAQYQVNLNYPKERLISITGSMNGIRNAPDTIIHDLRIHTTKTTYALRTGGSMDPLARLTEFRIPLEPGGGRIVGFFGRAGSHLNSIGARLEPC